MMVHEFLAHLTHQRRLSAHTVTAYRKDLEQFGVFCEERYGVTRATDVDRKHIKAWLTELVAGQQLAASSIRRKLSAVRAYFRYRKARGQQREDPSVRIPVPKLSKRLPTTIAEEDLRKLFASFPDPLADTTFSSLRDHLILALLYQTGMRRAELIGLRVQDVYLARGRLRVLGKGNKERLIPFGDRLGELLGAYGEQREGQVSDATPNLLITDKGRPLYPKYVYNTVVRYLGAFSKEEKRSPHVLRHTFATELLRGGAELNAVKELLGHANLAATQVYTHSDVTRLRKVYQRAHPAGGEKKGLSAPKK